MVNNYLKKENNKINHKNFSNKLWYLTNDKVKKIKINFTLLVDPTLW